MIEQAGFGGLLKLGCDTLPGSLCKWLVKNFDAESSELVILGRGRIKVTADSVHQVLGIPTGGGEVVYAFNDNATMFINEKYGITDGLADDFLRSWMMLAVCTFLSPNTGLNISPKFYPSLVDLSSIMGLDWCKFVVNQLRNSMNSMGRRNSISECLFFLVILYLDSLVVQNVAIPTCPVCVEAWNRQLISKVIELDKIQEGTFCNLKISSSF